MLREGLSLNLQPLLQLDCRVIRPRGVYTPQAGVFLKKMKIYSTTHKEMQPQFFVFISQVQTHSGDKNGQLQINGGLNVSCPGRIDHLRWNSDL